MPRRHLGHLLGHLLLALLQLTANGFLSCGGYLMEQSAPRFGQHTRHHPPLEAQVPCVVDAASRGVSRGTPMMRSGRGQLEGAFAVPRLQPQLWKPRKSRTAGTGVTAVHLQAAAATASLCGITAQTVANKIGNPLRHGLNEGVAGEPSNSELRILLERALGFFGEKHALLLLLL